jgi:hypothetical protein
MYLLYQDQVIDYRVYPLVKIPLQHLNIDSTEILLNYICINHTPTYRIAMNYLSDQLPNSLPPFSLRRYATENNIIANLSSHARKLLVSAPIQTVD